MNVAHFFARNARRDPDGPAVGLGGRPWLSHEALAERATRLAGALRSKLGLTPGDRVALIMPNRPEYLEIELAAWWAGCAIVPVNVRLHGSEHAWILEDAEVSVCFTTGELAAAIVPELTGSPDRLRIVGDRAYRQLLAAEPLALQEVPPDALAWLFYTSGTTGRPKGAMITHRNLRAMTYAYFIDVDRAGPRDAILHAAPMSHGSGCYITPFAAAGACHVVPESGGFDPAELFAMVGGWPGSHLFAAPTMVKRLAGWAAAHGPDLGNLATIVYGGAPMYLADLEDAHAALGFRLAQIYGQGESPMCITALDKEAHERAARSGRHDVLQSAGTVQSVVELRIGDATGRPLPPGEPGEVMARGECVVPGYWRNPAATADTMGDGWLRTGDIGVVDDRGYLTLKDRSKDLIISGGSNIYPREVEEVLLSHPALQEVSVIGLPDSEWGERVVACVVAGRPVPPDELDSWCTARIARFKRPRHYVFLAALPKSSYGKILKRELRAMLAARGTAP